MWYYFIEKSTFISPVQVNVSCCPPLSRKRWDIKSHSSVRHSVPLSVTKTLTLAITFALLQVELWYLACVFFVTRPFWWYQVVTLTVTFDLLQGQICCQAGNHNSLNLLVMMLKFNGIKSTHHTEHFLYWSSLQKMKGNKVISFWINSMVFSWFAKFYLAVVDLLC